MYGMEIKTSNMENFFHNDEFYFEFSDLLDQLYLEEKEIKELPDDFVLNCIESELKPIIELDGEWILDRIPDHMLPESDNTMELLSKAINENIDWVKVNSSIPRCYYPTRKKFTITKQDILDYIS